MIKSIFLCGLILLAATGAYAFKDVPDDHWAQAAVYSLVQRGITTGFPDGTFRGDQPVSRYEIAALLSKISTEAQAEKVRAELKTELAAVKYKIERYSTTASWGANLRVLSGNAVNKFDYRLKAAYSQPWGPGIGSIDLDTLDAGYNTSATRGFTDLLNFNFTGHKNNLGYLFTAGTRDILHQETLIPSENYLVFPGLYPAAGVAGRFDNIDIAAVIRARNVAASGEAGFTEIDITLSHTFFQVPVFNKVKLALRPRYFMSSATNNFRVEVSFYQAASPGFNQTLSLDLGYARNFPHGLAAMYALNLKNDTTELALDLKKLGAEFRGNWEYYILNIFDRAILDGAYDAGIKLTQKINDRLSLAYWGNINTNYSTSQVNGQLGPFKLFYRWYNVPGGNDGYGSAPINSNLMGLEFSL